MTHSLRLEVKYISSNLTHKIRKEVLWPHIKNNKFSIDIDTHKDTFHLGAYINNNIVSIGTFVKEKNKEFNNNKQYRLRAMATDLKFKEMGYGKKLFSHAINILKNKQIELLWCDARLEAIPFYKKLHMKSLNTIYNIKNIGPHQTMYIHI